MELVYSITTLGALALDNDIDPTAHTGFDKVQLASLFVGVFLPLVVGLITKRYTAPAVKAVLLMAGSALTAFVTEWANSANFVWQQALLTMLMTFGTAYVSYRGFWVPTGAAQKAQDAFGGDKPQRGAITVPTGLYVALAAVLAAITIWAVVMYLRT